MPDASVNLIITDPPYEIGTGGGGLSRNTKIHDKKLQAIAKGFDLSLLDELKRVCKPFNAYFL